MPETHTSDARDAPRERNVFLSTLNAIDQGLGWIERFIVAGSVLVMAGLMSAHVIVNLFFNQGIPGTYEVTEMLIVLMTFVGVGYAARCARHISMSAIYDQLGGRLRKALLIVICVGTAALMFYFAYKSAQYVWVLHERGRTSSSLHVPLWIINTALPIGFTLAGVQYVLTTIRNLVSDDIYRSFTEKEEYSDVPLDDSGQTHVPDEPHGI